MDSGSSGSLRSSSGGDDNQEFDSSRSIRSLFDSSHHQFGTVDQLQNNPNFFDSSSYNNLFHGFSQSQSMNPVNIEMVGSRSNHLMNYTANNNNQSVVVGGGGGGDHRESVTTTSSTRFKVSSTTTTTTLGTKNPKKRTRASRRAPTTVLTTDTSNFRAMVQEFTGIPAPPFSSSSPFSRRLDLFGSASTGANSLMGSSSLIYPLRPSPQKINQQQQHTPLILTNSMANTNINMQNPMLLLQPPPPIPPQSSSLNNMATNLGQDQLAMNVNNEPQPRIDSNINWRDHSNVNLRQFDIGVRGNVSNCKLSYTDTGTSIDHFQHDHNKGSLDNVNVGPRGDQGTIDTWICPSD